MKCTVIKPNIKNECNADIEMSFYKEPTKKQIDTYNAKKLYNFKIDKLAWEIYKVNIKLKSKAIRKLH